jgi:hypothetical protein
VNWPDPIPLSPAIRDAASQWVALASRAEDLGASENAVQATLKSATPIAALQQVVAQRASLN